MERERRVLQHALDAAVRAEDYLEAARLRDLLAAFGRGDRRATWPPPVLAYTGPLSVLHDRRQASTTDDDPRSIRLELHERMARWAPVVEAALLDLLEARLGHRPGPHGLRTACVRVITLSSSTVELYWQGERVMAVRYADDPHTPPHLLPEHP